MSTDDKIIQTAADAIRVTRGEVIGHTTAWPQTRSEVLYAHAVLAAVEPLIRAKIAAEIRADASDWKWVGGPVQDGLEIAARIAEGGDQ